LFKLILRCHLILKFHKITKILIGEKMLNVYRQLAVLDQLYKIYDQYVDSLDIACKKFCADCCTCNVTMTTIEAHKIISALDMDSKKAMQEKLDQQMKKQRFIPKITTNQLADICLSDDDPPEEAIDPSWGACPLLTDKACPIYNLRPFGCRNMVSTKQCAETGVAEIDDFTITVNHVFLQYIEHIDQNGFSGNLSDVLAHTIFNESADTGSQVTIRQTTLIKNTPLSALLVPPEHRKKIEPILAALRAIKA
jgi:Fe-S-cluster containining protein